jgi:hypothetical protein
MKLANRLWRATAKGEPPPVPGWAKWIVGKPLKKGVKTRVADVPV